MRKAFLYGLVGFFAFIGICTILVVSLGESESPDPSSDSVREDTAQPTANTEQTAAPEPTPTSTPELGATSEPTATPTPTATAIPTPSATPRPVISLTAPELYALRETNSERYDYEYKGRTVLIRGTICEIESDTIDLSASDSFACAFESVALNDLPLATLLSPSVGDTILALCIVGEYIFGTIQLNACEIPNQTLLEAFATATPTPTPIPSLGESRNVPIPFGQVGVVDNGPADRWEVTVVSVDEDAWVAIQAENRFNDPPEEGNQFFIVQISAKFLGEQSGEFDAGFRLKAVGEEGVVYETFSNRCGVIPDEFPSSSEIFSGGSLEGNECWQIRIADRDSLVMLVEPDWLTDGPRVWFALRP